MNPETKNLISNLKFNNPLPETEFNAIYEKIDCKFSDDYIEFMRCYNGGIGPILNGQWANFTSFEKLVEDNELTEMNKRAPLLFLIGGNGSSSAFAVRRSDGLFIFISYYDLGDEEEGEKVGYTFQDFLKYLSTPLE